MRTNASQFFFLSPDAPPPVGGAPAVPAPATPAAATPPEPAPGAVPPAPAAPSPPSAVTDKPAPTAVTEPAPAAFDPAKLQLPEGMKADDPTFQKFAGLMTDANLSPADRGQQLLNLYNDAVKQSRDASKTAWDNVNAEWSKATTTDPEIGGAKWDSTKLTIARAIDGLGPDLAAGFRQALDVTGAGNHPAIVKALHAMASKLVEGAHISGNGPVEPPKDLGSVFFPNSKMRGK